MKLTNDEAVPTAKSFDPFRCINISDIANYVSTVNSFNFKIMIKYKQITKI